MSHFRLLLAASSALAALIIIAFGSSSNNELSREKGDYQRIISLAPSYTEVILALGESHRLVGVTTQCPLKHLPQIGSFAEANFEGIMALKPDLILAVPHVMAQEVLQMLKAQGIAIYAEQPDSLADIKKINKEVAKLLGIKDRGDEINRHLKASIHDAKLGIAKKLKSHEDKGAIVAISYNPLVVAGSGTFPAEILEGVGLINLAAAIGPWPVWSMEALLSLRPKLLIVAEGEEKRHHYEKLFSVIGIKPHELGITIVIPKKPIFSSPSPLLIKDMQRLMALFNEAL